MTQNCYEIMIILISLWQRVFFLMFRRTKNCLDSVHCWNKCTIQGLPKLSNGGSCWCVFNCVKNLANLKIYISITALQEKSFTAVLLQMLILIYIFKDWSHPFKVPITYNLHLRYLTSCSPLPQCLFFNFYKCGGHCQIVNIPLWSNCDRSKMCFIINKPSNQYHEDVH